MVLLPDQAVPADETQSITITVMNQQMDPIAGAFVMLSLVSQPSSIRIRVRDLGDDNRVQIANLREGDVYKVCAGAERYLTTCIEEVRISKRRTNIAVSLPLEHYDKPMFHAKVPVSVYGVVAGLDVGAAKTVEVCISETARPSMQKCAAVSEFGSYLLSVDPAPARIEVRYRGTKTILAERLIVVPDAGQHSFDINVKLNSQ